MTTTNPGEKTAEEAADENTKYLTRQLAEVLTLKNYSPDRAEELIEIFLISIKANWETASTQQKEQAGGRCFVNVYNDGIGRFIGDTDYESHQDAYQNRDDLHTYVETVELVRTK